MALLDEGNTGADRLIFALDVPTESRARELVDDLQGTVSFYKIGLELFLGGATRPLLESLRDSRVFLDLKLPNDIGETIRRVVALAASLGVRFLTLSTGAHPATLRAARAGRGDSPFPKFLYVPYVSSMDARDFAEESGRPESEFDAHIVEIAGRALESGCDGLIASGETIGLLRAAYPDTALVCPGIRRSSDAGDDHKRSATPARAIELGADYLVVGRPIRNAETPEERRRVAAEIIREVDQALAVR